jgi:uncharacterized protein
MATLFIRTLVALVGLWFASSEIFAQSSRPEILGHWEGTMVREGSVLAVSFDFSTDDGRLIGAFNADALRALGIPLSAVEVLAPKVTFALVGDTSQITFEGEVDSSGVLRGSFRDGEARGTFLLRKLNAELLPYRSEEVRIENGAVVLAGTVFIPLSAGRHPAVVFNHGSGAEGRFASRFFADRMARRGIATLIYDKRGVGASTGDWRQATFEDLASDAIAAVHSLQRRPEINASQVGIYGHSQGGTIAPLIAAGSTDVAFVIAAAAIGMPIYEQDRYRTRNELRAVGLTDAEQTQALQFFNRWLDMVLTGNGRDELASLTDAARQERWFKYVAPPSPTSYLWKWYPPVGRYNGLQFWERVTVPVLLVYGERDENTPRSESISNIERALAKAGNKDYTAVILPMAAHDLTVRPDVGQPFDWPHLAPGTPELLIGWILSRTGIAR